MEERQKVHSEYIIWGLGLQRQAKDEEGKYSFQDGSESERLEEPYRDGGKGWQKYMVMEASKRKKVRAG